MIDHPAHIQAGIPSRSGTYVLLLRLAQMARMRTSRLGTFDFPAGIYLYVGSAFGPGGLAARLRRHLAGPGRRLHWHIDYLRRRATPVQLWLSVGTVRLEHEWAGLIQELPGANMPAPRFGASDCRCPSHLFQFREMPGYDDFKLAMRKRIGHDVPVQQYLLS